MPLSTLLDDRRVTILRTIIETYLETGELVGSRATSKYPDLKLGSATIRNEMSDLEEMGHIIQPYTLVERILPDKGHRFYADQITLDKESRVAKFKEMMVQKVNESESILEKMVQVLIANADYATTIDGPSCHKTKLKLIQFSKMEKYKLLVVVVMEGNIIKDTIIDIEDNPSDEKLLNLNILLGSGLNGLATEEINLDVISKLEGDARNRSQVVDLVLNEVVEAIRVGEGDPQIYTSRTTNISKYPEFSDSDKASRFVDALEYKEVLQEFVGEVNSRIEEEADIQVYIGGGSPVQSIKNYSVVTANYDSGGGLRGTIGIIGPKRMDYGKVLGTLRSLMNQLDTVFKKDER